MAQTEYLVIVEKYESGAFGAYVPELPGIGVAGETEDEVRDVVGEAIRLISMSSIGMTVAGRRRSS